METVSSYVMDDEIEQVDLGRGRCSFKTITVEFSRKKRRRDISDVSSRPQSKVFFVLGSPYFLLVRLRRYSMLVSLETRNLFILQTTGLFCLKISQVIDINKTRLGLGG